MGILSDKQFLVGPVVFKKDGQPSFGFGSHTEACVIIPKDQWAKIYAEVAAAEALVAKLKAEVERLAKREGSAKHSLLIPTDDNPFERVGLSVVDFGVADNIYVLELPAGMPLRGEGGK